MSAAARTRNPSPGLPPWMWLWLVLFTTHLPFLALTLFDYYQQTAAQSRANVETIDTSMFPQAGLITAVVFAEMFARVVPLGSLVLSLLPVVFPSVRSRFIERRNRLVPPPPALRALGEIEEFVGAHAPGLGVKVNLRRPGLVWIYPNGYRRATLAVFGGLVMLWKSDREAAEAVLLHEIAHYRRGDALFMGPGSFVETAVKLTLLLNLLVVFLPWLVLIVLMNLNAFGQVTELSSFDEFEKFARAVGLSDYVPNEVSFLVAFNVIMLLFVLLLALMMATNFVIYFTVPVACMWSAEFNADLSVAETRHRAAILRELGRKRARVSLRRWVLFRLSHPPEFLRRFFLRRGGPHGSLLALLLVMPLTLFAPLLMAFVVGFSLMLFVSLIGVVVGPLSPSEAQQFAPVGTWGEFLPSYLDFARTYVTATKYFWLGMTVLLVCWTAAARPWERFFTRGLAPYLPPRETHDYGARPTTGGPPRPLVYYLLAAAFTGAVLLVGLVWPN